MGDYNTVYNKRCDTIVITDGKVSIRIPFFELERIVNEVRAKRVIEESREEMEKWTENISLK